MPTNPYHNLLFYYIDGFEVSLIFSVPILDLSFPTLREDNCEFPTLGSTHNCPCTTVRICLDSKWFTILFESH